MVDFDIRPVGVHEECLILTFLYLAARMPESGEPIEKALANPQLKKYWAGWGRPGDTGLVAVERSTNIPVSCTWARLFSRSEAGGTFVADDIPELGIATVDGFRGQGLGSAVLKAMIPSAAVRYRGICLNVREGNPAVRLYERLGFHKIAESEVTNRVGTRSFNMLLEFW